ncbi:MAG: glycosyltransferase family 4 protein [Patescibacteria group bacterium]
MRLLILTQKVDANDDVLGFMHGWIAEFAKNYELVTAICLEKGEANLPDNVKVLSLGKEAGCSKIKYIYNFYRYIWSERKNYDKIFVHMNQEYILLGGIFWKFWRKRIGLWYAHGSIPFSLRIAEKMSDIIFTSTQSGFRLKSGKKRVVGQGIDISKFKPSLKHHNNDFFNIVTVGRISPVKDYETLIRAIEILAKENLKIKANIIGGAGRKSQEEYLESLKRMVSRKGLSGIIKFLGSIPNKDIVDYLQFSDLFANMSYTGSLDKAILEAMACGLPILTCNEALEEVLANYRETLMYKKSAHQELSEKIRFLIKMPKEKRRNTGDDLRSIVVNNHSLKGLIKKISDLL